MTQRFVIRSTLLAVILAAGISGCASETTDDEPQPPPKVDVETTAPAKVKEDLCSHAVRLYWHAADPGEAERARDMMNMFCDVD